MRSHAKIYVEFAVLEANLPVPVNPLKDSTSAIFFYYMNNKRKKKRR
jgi:hypothetical protein